MRRSLSLHHLLPFCARCWLLLPVALLAFSPSLTTSASAVEPTGTGPESGDGSPGAAVPADTITVTVTFTVTETVEEDETATLTPMPEESVVVTNSPTPTVTVTSTPTATATESPVVPSPTSTATSTPAASATGTVIVEPTSMRQTPVPTLPVASPTSTATAGVATPAPVDTPEPPPPESAPANTPTVSASPLSRLLHMPLIFRDGRPPVPLPTAPPTVAPLPTPIPTLPPIATPIPTPLPPEPGGANLVCEVEGSAQICAWVSNGTPARRSEVTVYGRLYVDGQPQEGRPMVTRWHYRTTTQDCDTGVTNPDGVAGCTRNIGGATAGYQVDVDVTIDGHSVTTWFIPP